MRVGRVAAVALAALGLAASPAHAWDEVGHRVVARIAWDHMTPAARDAAVRLLLRAPANSGILGLVPAGTPEAERGRELFVMAAYWPDIIRSRGILGYPYAHSDWHYVNFFWEQQRPGGPVTDQPGRTDGQLLNQLPRLAATLADASASDSARSVSLAWILHLVGDAHQPLHNSARITAQDPQGDRGGNLFLLGGIYPRSNLHGYWDALVGLSEPWLAGEREAGYIGRISARLARRYTPSWARGRLLPGQFEQWSREGVRVAQTTAYPAWLARGQPAPARYLPYAWGAAQPRLAIAGYRLADVLNRALAP